VKLRYAGYVYDDESGLYYCSARYYDPVTCQFISKDPARADGEESAYQYCGGDPVGKVDPSGEFAIQFRWPAGWPKKKSSEYLLKVLRRNAGYAFKNRWRRVNPSRWLRWWVGMVNHNRPWDLKRSYSNVRAKSAWLLGVRVSPEDYGNMHYGYVGRAAGFPLQVLRAGGHKAAGLSVQKQVHELFHDGPRVALGFKLYSVFGRRIRSGEHHCDRWVR
jgi:RHS repeat-associated protein